MEALQLGMKIISGSTGQGKVTQMSELLKQSADLASSGRLIKIEDLKEIPCR